MASVAEQYGQALRVLNDQIQAFLAAVAKGFSEGPPKLSDAERRELLSKRAYQDRIERERREGLRFVRDCAAAKRRELGLS